ncbi:MAG: hypothetical protein FWB72_03285 [Firmicutes bacterium]|nr:hypothetical protein [Bacillota bacterium]
MSETQKKQNVQKTETKQAPPPKLFGTDGIRGIVGEKITPTLMYKLGRALVNIKKREIDAYYNIVYSPSVLIGTDTRVSKDMLSLSLAAGITSAGGKAILGGVLPTPVVAYLSKTMSVDFGAVITASHNPPNYNGVKVFNLDGNKITAEQIALIEQLCADDNAQSLHQGGQLEFKPEQFKEYADYILEMFVDEKVVGSSKASATDTPLPLSTLKIGLDCANGATSPFAKKLFESLGARVSAINTSGDGKKINVKCGSTNVTALAKLVVEQGLDIGFAFDGDGDRIIGVLADGNLLCGDKILYLLATDLKAKGSLSQSTVVGTHTSNSGLENALHKIGCHFIRTDIGDTHIAKEMRANGFALGGENSGHIILSEHLFCGDGLYTAAYIANMLSRSKRKFNATLKSLKLLPVISINIPLKCFKILDCPQFTQSVENYKKKLGKKCRVLIRKSGTESMLRIFVEGENYESVSLVANTIKNLTLNIVH